jgi:hypothetical protein
MPKRDYYDDPAAPPANSLVVAVVVVVLDDAGRVLMIQRADNDFWALPGGAQDDLMRSRSIGPGLHQGVLAPVCPGKRSRVRQPIRLCGRRALASSPLGCREP